MSQLNKKETDTQKIQYTYAGIKVFRTHFTRMRDSFTTVSDFEYLLNDWNHYKKIMNGDISSVPIIMMEIESVDTIIQTIVSTLSPDW